jgi:hypothetical protein
MFIIAVALELTKMDTKVQYAGTLSMCLAAIGIVESGKFETAGAPKAVQDLESSAAVSSVTGVVDTFVKVQSKAGDIESSLGVLISKIDIIVRVGEKLATVSCFFIIWVPLMAILRSIHTPMLPGRC